MADEPSTDASSGALADPWRRELAAAEARIQFLTRHDPLTGLPNRSTFLRQVAGVFEQAKQHGECLALLFVDVDHFKRVNDSLGHEVGDAVLHTVAQRIQGALRVTDLVGRFAGDEFLVLLGGNPQEAAIDEVVRKLLESIEAPLQLEDHRSISVTASVGVALYPQHSTRPDELLRQADTAATHARVVGAPRPAALHRP
jgi:diguanylate cyclase (GGDEF)-like protein